MANEKEMIEHFNANRHFAEMRNAKLGGRDVRLIGLFGSVAEGEIQKFGLRAIAKKGLVTYYEFAK